MGITTTKGDIGHAMIMADLLKRGFKVALPFGDDWPFDLILYRKNKLERVQCKFTRSDGKCIKAVCRSTNGWNTYCYTKELIDWMAIYDVTTDACYYLPAEMLGDGRAEITLRLTHTGNNQKIGINWAANFQELDGTLPPVWNIRTINVVEYEEFSF
jgi:hypothetical protein